MSRLLSYIKNPDNDFFLASLLIIIFIPLYPKFPLINIPGTFVAARLEDFLIGFFLIFWILVLKSKNLILNFFKDKLNQIILLYFFIGFVSLFSAVFITWTIVPHLGLFHFLRRVEFMLLLPAFYTAIRNGREQKISLLLLSVTVLIVNMYAFGQKFLNFPVISTTNSEFSKGLILYLTEGARVNSTFAGHYDLAVFLVMTLSILAALFFVSKNIWVRLWITLLSLTSSLVLVLTAARLSFFSAFIGIAISLILVGRKLLILLLVICSVGLFLYPSSLRDRFISTININLAHEGERFKPSSPVQERRSALNIPTLPNYEISKQAEATFSSTISDKIASDIAPGEPVDQTELEIYRSLNIRLKVEWPRAINAFVKNPLLGTGFSSLGLATDNDLFRAMGEVGLLGLAAFFLVIWAIYKRCLKIYKEPSGFAKFFSAGCLAMVTAFLLNSLVIDVFEASKTASIFWIILGVNLASLKFK